MGEYLLAARALILVESNHGVGYSTDIITRNPINQIDHACDSIEVTESTSPAQDKPNQRERFDFAPFFAAPVGAAGNVRVVVI